MENMYYVNQLSLVQKNNAKNFLRFPKNKNVF